MKEFFESEMQEFTALANEFAQAYPEQAALLNIDSIVDRDPYVERLFEGMAFLIAGVKQRLSRGVPELSEQLLEQMSPGLKQTYPSSCVMSFRLPDDGPATLVLPKKQKVSTRNLGPNSIACHFTTTREEVLRPLEILSIDRSESRQYNDQLDICFAKTGEHAWKDMSLGRLSVYLQGERSLVYRLWQLLTHEDTHCTLLQSEEHKPGRLSFSPQLLANQPGMLPETGRDVAAYALPLDYFCARESFFYLDLSGVDASVLDENTKTFTIRVQSQLQLPSNHKVTAEQLHLNTAPAVNLFSAEAEPLRFDHTRDEYPLHPDTSYLGHMEIFSVDQVVGRNLHTGIESRYLPLYAQGYRNHQDNAFYVTSSKKPSGGRQSRLVLHQAGQPRSEIISTSVTASNGYYPRQHLKLGDLNEVRHEACPGIKASNITRPSQPKQPPQEDTLEWRWIGLMAQSLRTLEEKNQVQQLLKLFDWSGDAASRRKIEALLAFSKTLQHRMHRGALCRVWSVHLSLESASFDSIADAELYGYMLHQLMTAMAPVGEWVETRMLLLPGYEEKLWIPLFQ